VKCVANCPCPYCISQNPSREFIGSGPTGCCFGMTANCLACAAGMTEERYCAENPDTSGCKTEVELSALDHLWAPLAKFIGSGPTGRKCCYAYTLNCMACAAGMTDQRYCAENPDFYGCKTEVELSALDTLEAPLARTAGMSKDYCAENPNTSRCRMQKELYCARNPESSYCKPEVELSAVDTLEALLARIKFAHKKKTRPRLSKRCCNGGRCYLCR